jgi:hypothetical protein
VGELADVVSVDPHGARRGVDEPGEELGERALASSGRTHDRHDPAGGDVEVDTAEHLWTVLVREVHVVQPQVGRPGVA